MGGIYNILEPDITQESLLSHMVLKQIILSVITDCLPVFRRTGLGTCSMVWALDRLICECNRSTACPNCLNQYTCDRVQPIGFHTSRSTYPSDFYSPLARLNHNSKHEIINIYHCLLIWYIRIKTNNNEWAQVRRKY